MLGIAAGDWLSLPLAAALALALVAALAVGWARRRGSLIGVAILGLAVAAGVVGQAARARPPPGLLDEQRQTIDATLATPPDRAFGVTRLSVDLDAVARDGLQRSAA